MPMRFVPFLLIGAAFGIAVWLDFFVWPGQQTAILFVLPLAIASRFAGLRTVTAVAVLALICDGISATQTTDPLDLTIVRAISLMVIALLAGWVARARQADARRVDELNRAREQLREFMGLVVHDLRNPLGVAHGYAEMLERKLPSGTSSDARRYLAAIDRSINTMGRLLADLGDAIRLGGHRFVIDVAPVDLAELVGATVADQAPLDPTHRIRVDTPEHLSIEADADRLRQVVVNLLTNAGKYSPAGTEIDVTLRASADAVSLSVEDHGHGITRSAQGEIFQPFVRLTEERTVGGTGLGLYIAKGIVEAHGGTITVSSVVGQGSTFVVTLPRHTIGLPTGSADAGSPSP